MPWYRLVPLSLGLVLITAALMVPNFYRFHFILPLGLAIGFVGARWLMSIPHRKVHRLWLQFCFRWRYPYSSIPVVGLTLLLAVIPSLGRGHFPYPSNHDELSYHLAADTFARGRLTNPSPPGWEHFESFHINVVPTYHSKYQPGMGLVMAAGQLLGGHPYCGVLIALALAALALDWMFHLWLPVRWALFATLLACFPLCNDWSDCYFPGGPLATAAGAVLLGCYRQIHDRGISWYHGFLLGLVLVVFFWTRPFEGSIVATLVGIPLIVLVARKYGILRLIWPLGVTSLIALAPAVYFQMQLNKACVGSPSKMPYLEHEQQYGQTPLFLLQSPRRDVPTYRHEQIAEFNRSMANWHIRQRSGEAWLEILGFKFGVAWSYFFTVLWLFPLATLPELWRNGWARFALFIWVAILLMLQTVTWFLHHYAAPAYPAWAFVVVMSIRYVSLWKYRGYPLGRFLVIWGIIAVIVPVLTERTMATISAEHHWSAHQAKLVKQLLSDEQSDLVFLEYAQGHDPGQEWVYNGADIAGQHIIWARSMSPEKNERLIGYYPGRKVWLLKVDSNKKDYKPELVPYSQQ